MALCKFRIKYKIGKLSKKLPIIVYKIADSTNTQAKICAENGSYKNAVFIASEQTAGRGRLGRSFISERGKGLYLSILLGDGFSSDFAVSLTTYMAVIATRVIESMTGLNPKIKWVNDIYIGEKKLSGILTEGRASADGERLDYAVVGIGINMLSQSFDSEVKKIATSIEDECGKRLDVNDLAASIIKEFFDNLHLVGSQTIAEEYKERSFLIGEYVTVIKQCCEYEATVKDITDRCELLLSLPDGTEEILSTGEVSVKKAQV